VTARDQVKKLTLTLPPPFDAGDDRKIASLLDRCEEDMKHDGSCILYYKYFLISWEPTK
jgi:hypothetical protein